MREVPGTIDDTWLSGNFTGDRRAMVRATVQHIDLKLHDLGYNVYADFIFGTQKLPPRELPNLKSLKWTRGVDADVATATMELYNTAPQPLGTVFDPSYGIDQPGYYTFTRGTTSFSSRWGQTSNEWTNLLVGDNIVRTYEGYGFDATVCPDADPHLVQTGMWIIKDVTYDASGLITCDMEDMAAILRDQICFHPVIPPKFYPLSFSATPKISGFQDGRSYTVSTGLGKTDPEHPAPASWTGPITAVAGVNALNDPAGLRVSWTRAATPRAGYSHVGYQVKLDGARLPATYPSATTSAVIKTVDKGNVYNVQVVNIFKRAKDGHEQVGDDGNVLLAYPHTAGNASRVTPFSIRTNVGPPPAEFAATVPVPGSLAWTWDGGAPQSFVLVGFTKNQAAAQRHVFTVPATSGSTGSMYFPTGLGAAIGAMNWLVYPRSGASVGSGALASVDGGYLNPPVNGVPPHLPNPPSPAPTVTTKAGLTRLLNPVRLAATLSNTSNTYYNAGKAVDASVYGHWPHDALDGKSATYWLSIGNESPSRGFSYEWFEVALGNFEVSEVRFTTAKANYQVFLSVFSNGQWIQHSASDVIGYNPALPESHNGDNIPYAEMLVTGPGEGPHSITLRSPIPHTTRVRLSFHNLQDFGFGTFRFRAGLREVSVYGSTAGSKDPSAAVPGPAQDDNSPDVTTTYTVYVPPREVPGAGERPGLYEDYCVDTETEALTQRGWLRYDQIREGDLALAMDPETGLLDWQVVESVYRQHRKRTMVSMESQLHSSLTTPDHRWLVTDQAGRRSWRTTETLGTGHRIPLAGPVAAPTAAKYDDDFVELVAFFWTEGWVNGQFGNACLAQSETANPVHTARIRGALQRLYGDPGRMRRGLGAMWNETPRADGVVTFRLSKPVKDALLEVVPDMVLAPAFLIALTASQRTLLVERSLDADGWRTTGNRVGLAQRSEARVRAFEMACILDGRPVRTRQDGNGMWSVNLVRSQVTLPRNAKVEHVEYDGVIWCPTLKHHNWVARRHGTVYVTGNTDIVKLMLAWGGFYWPEGAKQLSCDGTVTTYDWGMGPYGLKNTDPVLGDQNGGRVWGDFEDTGTAGIANLPIPQWDKKTLLDSISYVRDIIGNLFFIDEQGAAVWRKPNIFSVGNYVGNLAAGAGRVGTVVTVDELQTLIGLHAKVSSRNVRERYFVASVDGRFGALAAGYNPNPTGLRRVGGWTDQNFGSNVEAQLMADWLALGALMSFRVDTLQIPGYPRIQVDDQIRIYERTVAEGYLHYVRNISSTNDLETGVWTYDLDTNWLGERPFDLWAFDIKALSQEMQGYLDALDLLDANGGAGAKSNPATATTTITKDVPKVSKLVQVTGDAKVYITDGLTKRHVVNPADRTFLVSAGLVPSNSPTAITAAELANLVLIGPA